jgi:ion channel POLLUX/CASTOR
MRGKVTWGERLRYAFDKSMGAGPIALIGWLALVSLGVIAAAGAFIALTGVAQEGDDGMGLGEAMWASLMRTLDAGTMGGDTGWGFRVVMLVVTLAGIFIVSTLIGVLSSGIDAKLGELRKGRSRILEEGHTIIFNWSPSIFDVISELVIANADQNRPRIVVMADKDKVEMEDEIKAKLPDTKNTKIICRRGDPTDLYDIGLANPQSSKSVVILSPEGEDPDSQAIKTILAIVHDPERREDPYQIAAEIREAKNATLARAVGGKEVQLVLADDLIAKIVVHSSRQVGLSAVYAELLDFEGCEIYTADAPELAGKTFGAALALYGDCALIGITEADGTVQLSPAMDRVIEKGSHAIIIAEDDSKIRPSGVPSIDEGAIRNREHAPSGPERILLLGWNRRGAMIAREMGQYVTAGSVLTVAADAPGFLEEASGIDAGPHLTVEAKEVDTGNRTAIEALGLGSYDHVLVLGYSDAMGAQAADTRTLVTLLHLRQIAEVTGRKIGVVSEMIDVRNRSLAEVTRADDFVVSNKLVSLMLAQASENENIEKVFEDLLDEQGSEIMMRPAGDFVALGQPVNFYTVLEAARRHGETAFGHRVKRDASNDPRNMGGVVINPPKAAKTVYQDGDMIVVLARD